MPLRSIRRKFVLLCALAAGAFIAAIFLIHATGVGRDAGSRISINRAAPHRPDSIPANAAELHRIGASPNPAAQRAGPPSPVAQQRAAASAVKAAQAAADLAASTH